MQSCDLTMVRRFYYIPKTILNSTKISTYIEPCPTMLKILILADVPQAKFFIRHIYVLLKTIICYHFIPCYQLLYNTIGYKEDNVRQCKDNVEISSNL